jgi:hypothetical protein
MGPIAMQGGIMTDKMMETMTDKDAFHFAKLSLFNARLMSDLQELRNSGSAEGNVVERIIQERACHDHLRLDPEDSLVNQSIFLGMAYVTVVWLTERFDRNKIAHEIEKRGGFKGLAAHGPRAPRGDLSSTEYLRLIRNAISHGKVDATDTHFIFSDRHPKEDQPTCVRLTWEQLGRLTVDTLFSVNAMLYPNPSGPSEHMT